MRARSAAFILSLVCFSTAATAGGPATEIASYPFTGAWSGGAYASSETGQFSYCIAGVTYRSGIYMDVMVDRGFNWALGFESPSWNLSLDQTVPLVAHFDGGPAWALTAYPLARHLVTVPMADNSALISAFRGAYTMSVQAGGETFGFDLTNTSALIPELVQCVQSQLAGTSGQPAASATSLELEATRVASNLLLAAKLPDAHLLPPSETPAALRGRGVAWTSDDGSGAVELLPATVGQGPAAVGSELIDSDARACNGDFASGRSSALVGDKVVTKVFTGCKDRQAASLVRYFIVQGSGGEFIVYSLFGDKTTAPPASGSPLSDPTFQAAAVTAAYSP